jgi:hypothetical protein
MSSNVASGAADANVPRDAEALAFAIDPGARRYGRNWRVRCIGHDDRHRSLDIADLPSGKIGLIDRSGRCSNEELVDRLRALGHWAPERRDVRCTPRFSWEDYWRSHPFDATKAAPACCYQQEGCEHWREFNLKYRLAFLRGELEAATSEIEAKYQVAGHSLDPANLRRALMLAIDVGGIGTAGFAADTLARALDIYVEGRVDAERARSN